MGNNLHISRFQVLGSTFKGYNEIKAWASPAVARSNWVLETMILHYREERGKLYREKK